MGVFQEQGLEATAKTIKYMRYFCIFAFTHLRIDVIINTSGKGVQEHSQTQTAQEKTQ